MVLVGVGWSREPGRVETGKWASDPQWAQNGGFENCTPQFFWIWCQLPMGPKWEVQVVPPMWGGLPIVVVLGWGMGGEVAPWLGMGNGSTASLGWGWALGVVFG